METANKSTNFTPLIAEMFATSPGHFSHYPDTLLFFLPLGRLAFPSSFHEVFFKWQLLTKPKAEGLTTIKKVLDTEIVHFVECNTMVRKYLCNYSVRTCSTPFFFSPIHTYQVHICHHNSWFHCKILNFKYYLTERNHLRVFRISLPQKMDQLIKTPEHH